MSRTRDGIAEPSLPSPGESYDVRNESAFRRAVSNVLSRIAQEIGNVNEMPSFSDADRPGAGDVTAGTVIWNTDDSQLNISDGTNWTLPDGTTT